MSIIFRKVFFRPSNESEFYSEPSNFLNHVKTKYIDTGKCTRFREKSYLTEDFSVQIVESEWVNQEAYDEYLIDPMSLTDKEQAISYNRDNNIMLIELGPKD